MNSSPYLEYEVALLLAKYGKDAVLHALAGKMQLSHEELESLLKQLPSRKPRGRSRDRTPMDSIDEIIRAHPAKAKCLRALNARFQNRTFLPELRDVRRFFEQHSRSLGSSKSRAESFRPLFNLLAELELPELDSLCQSEPNGEFSSLGVISDQILHGGKALPKR